MKAVVTTVHRKVLRRMRDLSYRILIDSGTILLCRVSGRMRYHRIALAVGDDVLIALSPQRDRGRILWRQ